MAMRYSGELTVRLQWKEAQSVNGRLPPHGGFYDCIVIYNRRVVSKSVVLAPATIHHAVDSPASYDHAAQAALSFANDEEPEIGEQGAYARSRGAWHIARSPKHKDGGD